MNKEKYSIIIPTMWKCKDLFEVMIHRYLACNLINEIIIINNNEKDTPRWSILTNNKIKILNQTENIKVNPAWNLGVLKSNNNKICIVNDDIIFDIEVFNKVYDYVITENGVTGLLFGKERLGHPPTTDKSIDIKKWKEPENIYGFGQLMFIHKSNWEPIIDQLTIGYGDDFIFHNCLIKGLDNYLIYNIDWYSPLGATTSNVEITGDYHEKEKEAWGKWITNAINNNKQKEKDVSINRIKKILLAIPTAKYIEPETFKSIYDLDIPEGYKVEFQFFYGYRVDQVRNLIAEWAKHYDYLFSVDSDIVLPKNTLKNFLAADKDIISGLYIQRIPNTHTLEVYMDTQDGGCTNIPYELIKDRGIVEIAGCGFGCVLIKSEIFRTIPYPHFEYHSALNHRDTISEDIDFAIKARKNGFKIWADSSIQCEHIGNTKFIVEDNRK